VLLWLSVPLRNLQIYLCVLVDPTVLQLPAAATSVHEPAALPAVLVCVRHTCLICCGFWKNNQWWSVCVRQSYLPLSMLSVLPVFWWS